MIVPDLLELLGELFAVVAGANPDRPDDVAGVLVVLATLRGQSEAIPPAARELCDDCLKLGDLLAKPSGSCAPVLATLGGMVTDLRQLVGDQQAAAADGAAAGTQGNAPDGIDLFAEFIAGTEKSLAQADQFVREVGDHRLTTSALHGLHRVFHTVQGVAGFLFIDGIAEVAGQTATTLDRCRTGEADFTSATIATVVETIATIRGQLGNLRSASLDQDQLGTDDVASSLAGRARP